MASNYPKRGNFMRPADFEKELKAYYGRETFKTYPTLKYTIKTFDFQDFEEWFPPPKPDRENTDLLILHLIREEKKRVELHGWKPVQLFMDPSIFEWLQDMRHVDLKHRLETDREWEIYGMQVRPVEEGLHSLPICIMAKDDFGTVRCTLCDLPE